MLNKDICKKCRKKHNRKWKNIDEQLWESQNHIFCSKTSYNNSIGVSLIAIPNNKPPKNCPYSLEHLIKENDV